MERNVTIEWLDDASPPDVAMLPPELLAVMEADLLAEAERLKRRRAVFDAGLSARYAPNPQPGTGWIMDGGKAVRVEVPKSVEWDQARLREAVRTVESWGEDPTQYVTMKLSVPESAYKAWPESIKSVFEPARTVKAGKPKISFHEPKVEAA